jgi:branched-chain amino acid transport system permease protein
LLAVLAFAGWVYNAPIGVLWRALAQNERRLQLFGFDTNQLKAVAFGISGLMAGVGGAIYAPQQGIVTPQVIGFGLSAELVIWAAVGGRASLFGPVIGTLLVGSLTAQLRDTLPFWEVLMALFFIAIVLVFPRGVAGLAEPLLRRFPPRRRKQAAIVAPGDPAARPPAKLALDDVSVHVGEVTILDQLSVDFEQAGIFCVIGPNGAGKTSMFNAVSGELGAASGKIGLGGVMTSGLAPHRVSALGVARKLQIPSVFPDLSIADNLAVALWSGRAGKLALLDPRLRRWTSPMLKELQSRYPFLAAGARKAAELSHGEQQILELAMALLTEPRVLLLDEPCAGLSPEETAAAMEIIRWAQQRLGGAIIIIEHDMSLVKELAQIVYVLHNGALLAKGSVAAIQADPAVRAVYVGGEK